MPKPDETAESVGRTEQPSASPRTDEGAATVVDVHRVRQRAYERFQMRGGEPGHDQEDWFEAERELKGGTE